ncbi:hypothetical protein [Cellulophaga sp. BC115SP]|uniref:phage head spike fiber domain-containing protein n=1 Tax=Cellulophaga sp. BC115SP TaxID=2683263 RepID=UPI001412AF6B|nr:hypothetical protein [Cellulophaga sp. BC115SP]NBB26743.1 hypothetical protein [Cellulophaga sp. BC115SP]
MAMVVRVKPEYNGKIAVQSSNSYNGIILSNNLSQETLVQIYNTEDELRDFLYTTYTTVGDSYAPSQIDPSLIHAYASEEITHNPAKTDYPANTVGKTLNEVKFSTENISTQFNRASLLPIHNYNFARARKTATSTNFIRNTIASYIDKYGNVRYVKKNQPRFTYDPITRECLGYLTEEYRTNFILNSTVLIGENTSLINKVVDQLAPDKTLSAVLISKKTNTSSSFVPVYATLPEGFYVRSLFVKAANSSQANIIFEGVGGTNGAGGNIAFDILTRTFSGNLNFAVSYGFEEHANGWLRPWVCVEKSSTKILKSTVFVGGYGSDSNYDNAMYIWGLQIENGKTLTSYIPTNGSTQQRDSDILSIKNSEFPKNAHTVVALGVTRGAWERTQNGYNRVVAHSQATYISYDVNTKISAYDSITSISTLPVEINSSFAYSASLIKRRIVANGGTVYATNNQNMDSVINNTSSEDIYIGCGAGGANNLNGTIKRIIIYANELPDLELQILTNKNSIVKDTGEALVSTSAINDLAFWTFNMLNQTTLKQEFSIDGTGSNITRNIRRPYPFTFEIIDSTSCSIISQPATICIENTDNSLTFTAPLGKTLTYAITPVYEN